MDPRSTAQPPASFALPLWPLPLLAGLLPALASLLALWLSMRAGLVPACNPLLEGCTSISRAARHDLPNQLFRAIVLPAASSAATAAATGCCAITAPWSTSDSPASPCC